MNEIINKSPKGIINHAQFNKRVSFKLIAPSEFLSHIIEHYWLIIWDLPTNHPHIQKVMPHPAIHASFLQQAASVQGITKNIYQHKLEGKGNLFGIKFKPAGFYPFANKANIAVAKLTDNKKPISHFFNLDVTKFTQHLLSLTDHHQKVEQVENILFNNFNDQNPMIYKLNHIVKQIELNPNILKTSDICQIFNLQPRQLQRLFSKYIGINAKWIIKRYRIHQALDILENENNFNWPQLALNLGYFDQAHFIRDFKSLIGLTPTQYIDSLKH